MDLPATLTRDYTSRVNIPFGSNNNTARVLLSRAVWNIMHVLVNDATTGEAGGVARSPESIWIVRGSTDGVGGHSAVTAVGVANPTNLWGTTPAAFPVAGLVDGGAGTNHHWILLENVNLQYELLLNITQSISSGYVCFSAGRSGTFSGGNANTQPPANGNSFQGGNASYSAYDGGQMTWWADVTYGTDFRSHITVAPSGEFWAATSRVGAGVFNSFLSLWKSTGSHVTDTVHNCFLAASSNDITTRGSCKFGLFSNNNFLAYRSPSGALKGYGGIEYPMVAGGYSTIAGQPTSGFTGKFAAMECNAVELQPHYRRGILPDWYMCGTEAVGASQPAAGATQLRVVVGDLILPCVGVTPLL